MTGIFAAAAMITQKFKLGRLVRDLKCQSFAIFNSDPSSDARSLSRCYSMSLSTSRASGKEAKNDWETRQMLRSLISHSDISSVSNT